MTHLYYLGYYLSVPRFIRRCQIIRGGNIPRFISQYPTNVRRTKRELVSKRMIYSTQTSIQLHLYIIASLDNITSNVLRTRTGTVIQWQCTRSQSRFNPGNRPQGESFLWLASRRMLRAKTLSHNFWPCGGWRAHGPEKAILRVPFAHHQFLYQQLAHLR